MSANVADRCEVAIRHMMRTAVAWTAAQDDEEALEAMKDAARVLVVVMADEQMDRKERMR